RCPSAYSVSNARLDLPEPLTPVTTVSAPRGMSTRTSRRLCVRAPSMWIAPVTLLRFGVDPALFLGREHRARQLLLLDGDAHHHARPRQHRPAQEQVIILHRLLVGRRALRLL